jgi:S-DNA-T family DNA segregation ATPase FtsK/SpoIIIE
MERRFVPIKTLLADTMAVAGRAITYLIGRQQDGTPFELDVREARHMLVGGGTGGGKSVLLHSIIFGIIFRYCASEVRLALADNKAIEFAQYRGMPHLWQDVVTTPEGFATLVGNLADELERRKRETVRTGRVDYPVIITIVDEFSGYDSDRLVRLIAEARAFNMFFVLATQHPTAEVVSTSIKANLMTGIAFRTRSGDGSRLVVGTSDATKLKTRGDCLVQASSLTRIQAGWVTGPRDRQVSDIGNLIEYVQRGRQAPGA